MNNIDFQFIATLLKERSGLILTPDKDYLLDTRLQPVARKHNLSGLPALIAAMRSANARALIDEVVDAMTTNETSFFRDRTPFDSLRKILLPALIRQRAAQRTLRIWSAACSTGQEPYSIAMILKDEFPILSNWRVDILATDISPSVLARAKEGAYSTFEVQRGLPVQLLVKHFEQTGDMWKIKPALRGMIDFRMANLLGDLSVFGTFDIVFCRNVLIYFDQPTKSQILSVLSERLGSHGALLLGGAESVFGLCDTLESRPDERGIYRRAAAGARMAPALSARRLS